MKEKKDVVVKAEAQKLTLFQHAPGLRLQRKSKVKVRGKPIFEEEEYSDPRRTSIISKERTKSRTDVYHEGKIIKYGKEIIHPKHWKSSKKHQK